MSFDLDDSDINFIPEVEIEHALQRAAVREQSHSSSEEDNLFADGRLQMKRGRPGASGN